MDALGHQMPCEVLALHPAGGENLPRNAASHVFRRRAGMKMMRYLHSYQEWLRLSEPCIVILLGRELGGSRPKLHRLDGPLSAPGTVKPLSSPQPCQGSSLYCAICRSCGRNVRPLVSWLKYGRMHPQTWDLEYGFRRRSMSGRSRMQPSLGSDHTPL